MNDTVIRAEDVSYTYPFQRESAIRNVSFRLRRGEAMLVTGASGCGKSTLLRILNGLSPQHFKGTLKGRLEICGTDCPAPMERISHHVGTLLQNPEEQILATTVEEEKALTLEWRSVPEDEIKKRVSGAPDGVREVDIVLGEDLDGDGIDDALYQDLLIQWETSDFWQWDEEFDPKKDHDGYGVSTIAEAMAGTDPFNSEDVLRITAFSRSRNGARSVDETVSLSFRCVGGRSYSVETATDLSKNDWTKCSFETDDSAGQVNVISLPSNSGGRPNTVYLLPKSSSNAFFRIRAE